MFFIFSKVFWTMVQPLNAICLLAMAGLLARRKWPKTGQGMITGAVLLLLIFGLFPTGPLLMTWLERQYPVVETPKNVDGMIVLGGAFETQLSRQTVKLNANADIGRMFCALEVAKANPRAKLIFSGGSGDIAHPENKEGDDVRKFLDITGFEHKDIVFEEKSRNTYENALYSKELAAPKPADKWVLITSAYHMPRSVGIFEKLNWNVVPYPCAQRMQGDYQDVFEGLPSVAGNFIMLSIATKEIFGTAIYYVTGKSAFFLPLARVTSDHATHN